MGGIDLQFIIVIVVIIIITVIIFFLGGGGKEVGCVLCMRRTVPYVRNSLHFLGSSFQDCSAHNEGGAIRSESDRLGVNITDSVFEGCSGQTVSFVTRVSHVMWSGEARACLVSGCVVSGARVWRVHM